MIRDMNVIRQILNKIAHSTEEVVSIQSIGNYENLSFYLRLLNEEGFVKKLTTRIQPNNEPYANSVSPDAVKMTWKGYELLDQLNVNQLAVARSQQNL